MFSKPHSTGFGSKLGLLLLWLNLLCLMVGVSACGVLFWLHLDPADPVFAELPMEQFDQPHAIGTAQQILTAKTESIPVDDPSMRVEVMSAKDAPPVIDGLYLHHAIYNADIGTVSVCPYMTQPSAQVITIKTISGVPYD